MYADQDSAGKLTNPPAISSPHIGHPGPRRFSWKFSPCVVKSDITILLSSLDTPHARNLWEWFPPKKVQAKDPLKSKLLRKTITGFVESSEEKENFAPWPLSISDRLFDGSQQLKYHWRHMSGWLYSEHNLTIRLQARLILWIHAETITPQVAKPKFPLRFLWEQNPETQANLECVCKTYIMCNSLCTILQTISLACRERQKLP